MNNDTKAHWSVCGGVFASACFVISLLFFICRRSLENFTILKLLAGISLCGLLLFFPLVYQKKSSFIFIVLLLVLTLYGLVVPLNFISTILSSCLFIYAIAKLLRRHKGVSLFHFIASFGASLFLILSIYGSVTDVITPLFLESVISGKAQPDSFFFASMSSALINYGAVSTQIHGLAETPYHFFTMLWVGAVSKIFGFKPIEFYNWVFPALSVALLFKYLYIFMNTAIKQRGENINAPIIFISILIYPVLFLGTSNIGAFLSSQSQVMGFIIQLIIWIIILNHQQEIMNDTWLQITLFLLSLLLLFTKASIGLSNMAIVSYMYLRHASAKKHFLSITISGIIFISICYFYFLNTRPPSEAPLSMANRVAMLNKYTPSIVSFIVPLFYLFFYTRKPSMDKTIDIKNIYIESELIILSTILSLSLGIYFSREPGDGAYFASTFFMLNLYFFYKIFEPKKTEYKYSVSGLAVFYILIFFNTPAFHFLPMKYYRQKIAGSKESVIKDLTLSLYQEKFLPSSIVAIRDTQHVYQKHFENHKTFYFLGGGLSENPGLMEIGNEEFSSSSYSFGAYKPFYRKIATMSGYISHAKNLGFNSLVVYHVVNGEIVRKVYK